MTRRELVLGAALVVLLAGGAGYAIGQTAGRAPGGHHAAAASAKPTPSDKPRAMPRESATGYSNNQLAQAIAGRAGQRLAGSSPAYISPAAARTLDSQVPPGARADAGTSTITFTTKAVSFTVVAVPPGGPDMTFRIGGLVNPTLVVPHDAAIRVRFINADNDQAHGWEVTSSGPPFEFGLGPPALSGALARPLGDPTRAGYGSEVITFRASRAGTYHYACPMPGHAQMGMHGTFIVR